MMTMVTVMRIASVMTASRWSQRLTSTVNNNDDDDDDDDDDYRDLAVFVTGGVPEV